MGNKVNAEARPGLGVRIVRRFVKGGFFSFKYKGLEKTVRYNDSSDVNKRVAYCIIHQLFPINTLHLMPPSDVNLFIISCGVSLMHLIPYSPRFEPRFPPPYLLLH